MSGATSPEAETIIRQTETITRLMGESNSGIERLARSLLPLERAQAKYEETVRKTNAALERGQATQGQVSTLIAAASAGVDRARVAQERLLTANDNAARSGRNFGTVIGQAGFQVQDFAVQVASGQSALTAFVQQGSQLAGIFGPAGAVVGAALAVGGIAIQFLTMGENAAEAQRKSQEAFQAAQRDAANTARVVAELSALFLSAAENASRLANAQRQALVVEAQQQMPRLTNEQTAAVQQYTQAQRELERIERSRATLERDLAAASPRSRAAIESDLREARAAEFSARSRFGAASSEMDRTGGRIGELRGLIDRAESIRTGPEEYGPNAPERRRGGGRSPEQVAMRLANERNAFLASNDPAERYAQTIQRINDLNERLVLAGQNPLPQAATLRAQQEALEAYNNALQGTQRQTDQLAASSKALAGITRGVGDAFSSAFEELVFNGGKAEDVMRSLERQLLRLGNQYLFNPLFQSGAEALFGSGKPGGAGGAGGGIGGIIGSLLGGAAKGAFSGSDAMIMPGGMGKGGFDGMNFTAETGGGMGGGGIGGLIGQGIGAIFSAFLHEGGVAGMDGRMRPVPAEVFLDAPRYHGGGMAGGMPFASDEVPAVLRRKEVVLTEGQQGAVRREMGRSIVVNQTIKAEDPGAFSRTRGQMAQDMRRDLARASRSA